jgi:hypothetical protein
MPGFERCDIAVEMTLMPPDKDKKLMALILLLAETWRSASIPSKGMRGDKVPLRETIVGSHLRLNGQPRQARMEKPFCRVSLSAPP